MKIDVLVYKGSDELDALGPSTVLLNAIKRGADGDVSLATHH